VVGVSDGACYNIPRVIPGVAAFIEQNAHHFGDGEHRMGIVEMNGRLFRKVFQRTVLTQMALHDVLNRGRNEKILLRKAQAFPLRVIIAGIEHLCEHLGHGLLLNRAHVFAFVEQIHVEFLRLCFPQPQQTDAPSVIAGGHQVIRNSGDRGRIAKRNRVIRAVPAVGNGAAELNGYGAFGMRHQPNVAAGQPRVRQLGLPTVHNLLTKNSVFIQKRIPGGRISAGGKSVQKARGKTAESAVAESGVRFTVINVRKPDTKIAERLFCGLFQSKIEQVVLQGTAHQEFHAEVIDFLFILFVRFFDELLAFLLQQVAHDEGKGKVKLFVGRLGRLDRKIVRKLGCNQLFHFSGRKTLLHNG